MHRLLDAVSVRVFYVDMPDLIFVTPPVIGQHEMFVSTRLSASERVFWMLHDTGHFLAGDSDERMRQEDYDPYPPWERQADLFAALGVLPGKDRTGDAEWVEQRLRQLVPTDHIAWTRYRVPATARALIEVLPLLDEMEG